MTQSQIRLRSGLGKNRLEVFSDGVLAIILTLMVLKLKASQGDGFAALGVLLPTPIATVWMGRHHSADQASVLTLASRSH